MISVILPTYNEAENIPIVVQRIAQVFQSQNIPFEILVVDDDSPDETWKVARQLASTEPWLRVLRRLSEKGLGPSVMDGFRASQGEWMVVMDADMQHDEGVLPQFYQHFLEGADIVVGTRRGEGGSLGDWNFIRKFISFTSTTLAHLTLGKTTTDPMSGFFGISKTFFAEVEPRINPQGFKILFELLAYCGQQHQLKEVGYTFRNRELGESKLSSWVIFQSLMSFYEISPIGRFVPVRMLRYGLVGLLGMGVNFLTSFLLRSFTSYQGSAALIIAIGVSIVFNYILNNRYTFPGQRLKGIVQFIYGLFSYSLICSAGAFLQYSVWFTLYTQVRLGFYPANVVGIGMATFWNYMLSSHIIWRTKT